jgi:hypothetical protein
MLERLSLMSILPSLLRSLLLTGIFSFLTPALFIGVILATLFVVGLIPRLEVVGTVGIEQVFLFLSIFGSGSALWGVVIISTTGSLVGMLFDAYTFYRYQNLRRP